MHHPMPGPLALPTEAEISEFAAQAAEGFAQTGLYVPHFLVACGLAIVWVENTGSTRSHTPSNALLVFLAMAIPAVLARRVSWQTLLSWLPRDAVVIAEAVAELWPAYLITRCIWFQGLVSFVCSLKDTTIGWPALACKIFQSGLDGCASLCRTTPTESMLPQMGVLMLLVFVAAVLYENAFTFLYETAIGLRFFWLCLDWVLVPRMIRWSKTKEAGEAVKELMTAYTSKLAGMLSTMADSDATTAPPISAGAAPPPVTLDGAALMKLTAVELRAMLVARGLSKGGAKAAMVNRLLAPP